MRSPLNLPPLRLALGFACGVVSLAAAEAPWQPLWNGRDFEGWDKYLTKPHASLKFAGEVRNAKGEHTGPLGVNRDPLQVFTVVSQDGAPAIRASGEVFGTITTKASFSNYHLRFQMKWGEKRGPLRLQQKRDGGVLYHADGPWGLVGPWLPSMECQIQEGDIGDFWAVNSRAQVRARPFDAKEFVFDPAAPPKRFAMAMPGFTRRVLKSGDFERPHGQWNTIEVICLGDKSWHVVNGHVVMALEDCERKDGDKWVPATSGRIQLQSEGSELFYRNVELQPIAELPEVVRTFARK